MKRYLISFFKEFEYDKDDAEYFVSVYDKIAADGTACGILFDAIAAYQANIDLNYEQEILARAKKIAEITGIHTYRNR